MFPDDTGTPDFKSHENQEKLKYFARHYLSNKPGLDGWAENIKAHQLIRRILENPPPRSVLKPAEFYKAWSVLRYRCRMCEIAKHAAHEMNGRNGRDEIDLFDPVLFSNKITKRQTMLLRLVERAGIIPAPKHIPLNLQPVEGCEWNKPKLFLVFILDRMLLDLEEATAHMIGARSISKERLPVWFCGNSIGIVKGKQGKKGEKRGGQRKSENLQRELHHRIQESKFTSETMKASGN